MVTRSLSAAENQNTNSATTAKPDSTESGFLFSRKLSRPFPPSVPSFPLPTLTAQPPPPAAFARRFPRSRPAPPPATQPASSSPAMSSSNPSKGPALGQSHGLELPSISFFGRTLAEYAQF